MSVNTQTNYAYAPPSTKIIAILIDDNIVIINTINKNIIVIGSIMITITDDTADKIYSGAILHVWSQCLQGVLPESGAPSSLGSDGDEEAPVFKKIAEDGAKVC